MSRKEVKEEQERGWVGWRDSESAGLEGAKGKVERSPAWTSGLVAEPGRSLELAPEEGVARGKPPLLQGVLASSPHSSPPKVHSGRIMFQAVWSTPA